MSLETLPLWQEIEVRSPTLAHPVPVLVARNIPTTGNPNRFQNLDIYLPLGDGNAAWSGHPVERLPPRTGAEIAYQVHLHGGAWREPSLDATSVEASVAHAFATPGSPLKAVASINYTLSEFPAHPADPYDAGADGHSDPSREAVFPDHLRDVIHGLNVLKALGLDDGSYVLTGHSAGSCLAMQATLIDPAFFGVAERTPPVPAVVVGLNGLYDLPGLVLGADAAHANGAKDYQSMLTAAYGPDDRRWSTFSPARLAPALIATQVAEGRAPKVVIVDQSARDQLVSMNQRDRLVEHLSRVDGLRVLIGERAEGRHAEVWQKGDALWLSVCDAIAAVGAQA